MDPLEFLCPLFAIVLVGLLLAGAVVFIYRLANRPRLPSSDEPSRCPACGRMLHDRDRHCPSCGLEVGTADFRQLNELNIAIRQVRLLLKRDELDEATTDRLVDLLHARRCLLLGEPVRRPEPRRAAPLPPPPPRETEPVNIQPVSPFSPGAAEEILDVIAVAPAAGPEPAPVVPEVAPEVVLAGPAATLTAPEPPRRRGNLFSAFMEERNILWGELVGGLLIVGCSIALVLTLWRSLQTIPYFPVLLFAGLTAALFGAGQYTLHHWKLQSTSRGLLLIAMLLAPLNLLLLADPSSRGPAPQSEWLDLAVAAIALMLFTGLVRASGRDLIGVDVLPGPLDRRWLLCLAVLGTAGSQLLTPHLLDAPQAGSLPARFLPLVGLPVLLHLLACGAVLGGLTLYSHRKALSERQTHALFAFLGMASFSLLAAFGFLLMRLEEADAGLVLFACPLILAGAPALAAGLLVYRKLEEDGNSALRTSGTGVALGGLLVMLIGVALAWPLPGHLLPALLLAGGVLATASFAARVPWAHLGAVPCLTLACVLGCYLASGRLPLETTSAQALLHLLASADSGLILVGAAAVLTALAAWLRDKQPEQSFVLGWSGVMIAALALAIVTGHGANYPLTAAGVHGACLLLGVLASLRWRSSALAHVAGTLMIPGSLWALSGIYPHRLETWGLVLSLETVALILAAVLLDRVKDNPLTAAARRVGLFTGALALLLAVSSGNFPTNPVHTITAGALTLSLFVQALHQRHESWFTAFQAGLIGVVLCAVTAFAQPRGWLSDARGLQAYGVGLALLSLAWVVARRALGDSPLLKPLLPAAWTGLDRVTLGGLAVGQLLLAGAAAGPGLLAEWVPDPGVVALAEVNGFGGWLLLGATGLALLAMLVGPPREEERRLRELAILGLVLLSFTAAALWSSMHIPDLAAASALRWGLAANFLAGSALVWLRRPLSRCAEAIHLAGAPATAEVLALLGAAAGGVVFLTTILTGLGFSGAPLPGPRPESIFAQMGPVASSIGPLLLVIVGLAGTSIRERSPGYALAACLLATASSMGGYALGVVRGGNVFDDGQAVLTILIGCFTAAGAALVWLAGRRRVGEGRLLAVQSWLGLIGVATLALILFPALLERSIRFWVFMGRVMSSPPDSRFVMLGGPMGWLALALAGAAAFWQETLHRSPRRIPVVGLLLLISGILVGSVARASDTPVLWLSYHTMVGWWGLLAVGIAVAGSLVPLRTLIWPENLSARPLRWWLAGLSSLLALLAVVGGSQANDSPAFPWHFWLTPLGAALSASVLTGTAALWFRHGGFTWFSGVLFTFATFLTWAAWGPDNAHAALLSIVIGLGISSAFWQAIELSRLRFAAAPYYWPGLSWPAAAGVSALALLAGLVGVAIIGDSFAARIGSFGPLGWAGLAAVGVAVAAALGDEKRTFARPGLYILGLVLAGLILHALELPPVRLAWAGALALAVQVGVAGLAMWAFSRIVSSLDSQTPSSFRLSLVESEWPWLAPAQSVAAGLVAVLGFAVAVSELPLVERLAGPLALALLVPAGVLLAMAVAIHSPTTSESQTPLTPNPSPLSSGERGERAPLSPNSPSRRQGRGEEGLLQAALAAGVAALAALAWAAPDPAGIAPWLQRNAWLLTALTASAWAILERWTTWRPGRTVGMVVAALAVLLAPVLLSQMFPLYDKLTRHTPLAGPAIAVVALALLALVGLALRLALRPERDPLNLSENWRTAYVYLAEVLLVLFFLHVRLNVPEIFLGWLARYWTLLILLLAFLGVGLSELCERHRLRVLAAPLQRTAIFLPLIPLLAFWARPPAFLHDFAETSAPGLKPLLGDLGKMPWNFDSHALIWFLAAALYAVVALARASRGWALVAALAGNFGLWALLMHAGIGFLLHPQAWLIPLGLIVLASEHINHDRLSREAAQSLRYLGISLIYVASTADLFLTGIGRSLWLPIILAVLCVLGVLGGILLRVRAFLFLGVGFLLVDLFAMIWHAAVDRAQTWLWWACGIVLGAAILALFALFEKRRNDVLELLDRFRRWD